MEFDFEIVPRPRKTQLVRLESHQISRDGVAKLRIMRSCDVYIGNRCFHRPWKLQKSIWAVPFRTLHPTHLTEEELDRYREHILSTPALKELLPSLKGKTLGCFCIPYRGHCHGNVLVQLAEKSEDV
jgi:hypothetical protein